MSLRFLQLVTLTDIFRHNLQEVQGTRSGLYLRASPLLLKTPCVATGEGLHCQVCRWSRKLEAPSWLGNRRLGLSLLVGRKDRLHSLAGRSHSGNLCPGP